MRRLLLATIVFLLLATSPASASTNDYLQSLRPNSIAFDDFMQSLPKGGDIHYHLSGGVYAESMIDWGAADGVCVSTTTLSLIHI